MYVLVGQWLPVFGCALYDLLWDVFCRCFVRGFIGASGHCWLSGG